MKGRLRVGFDGRALESPAAGVRRYVTELISALSSLGLPLDLVAIGGTAALPAGVERCSEPWHPPTNLGWMAVGVMRAARRAALDVYHAPAYTAPPVGVHPLIVTLHDVSYATHPEWYPHRIDPLRKWFYRASARAADRIITDSKFSEREIARAYGIQGERVHVIPLGAGPAFRPGRGDRPEGVPARYVLHVGDLHPRRNVRVVLEAVIQLRASGLAVSAVLAGLDRGLAQALAARAAQAGCPDALVALGRVSDAVLVDLYRGALAVVYPSMYEGFGLPLVEAMACGVPLLASRASTSEEIAGDAAVLLPIDDPGQWAAAIQALVEEPAHADDLRRRSLARASAFTWRRTAEATWRVYCECAQVDP